MRRERERRLFEEVARGLVQTGDAEPGIDEQRVIAPLDEPDVAPREPVDERLPQPPDHLVDRLACEPITDCDLHLSSGPRCGYATIMVAASLMPDCSVPTTLRPVVASFVV